MRQVKAMIRYWSSLFRRLRRELRRGRRRGLLWGWRRGRGLLWGWGWGLLWGRRRGWGLLWGRGVPRGPRYAATTTRVSHALEPYWSNPLCCVGVGYWADDGPWTWSSSRASTHSLSLVASRSTTIAWRDTSQSAKPFALLCRTVVASRALPSFLPSYHTLSYYRSSHLCLSTSHPAMSNHSFETLLVVWLQSTSTAFLLYPPVTPSIH